jgi:hypothetical protein
MYRRNRSHPRSFSHSRSGLPVRAPLEPLYLREPWLCPGAEGARVLCQPGQSGHAVTAVPGSGLALIVGGQITGGHTSVYELICFECGDNSYLDCSQQSSRPQKLRRPYTISGRLAPSGQHLRAVQPGHRRRVPQEPRGEEAP